MNLSYSRVFKNVIASLNAIESSRVILLQKIRKHGLMPCKYLYYILDYIEEVLSGILIKSWEQFHYCGLLIL